MAFDPITCWHVDVRSSSTPAFGEHGLHDVARHVADARPPGRRLARIRLALARLGPTDSLPSGTEPRVRPVRRVRRRAQRLSASASS